MSEPAPEGADTMRGRAAGSRLTLWLLVRASRWAVAAAVLAVLFVGLVALGALDPVGLRAAMGKTDPVETLFQALVTAIITGVTLVVTIAQLVLSQELGAVGDQRERMEGAMAFREDVEAVLEEPVSPPDPAGFLRALIDATGARAATLSASVATGHDAATRERVETYADALRADAAEVSDRLDGASFGTFQVLSAALDFNYSLKIYRARRLRADLGGGLSEEATAAIEDVLEALTLFGPAREHFKTLYFEWELTSLSRTIIYAAVPALLVSIGGVLYLSTPAAVPGSLLGVDHVVWVVSGATTVAIAPFALLLAYVLRIVTVTKRTLAMGPFVLRETDRDAGE